MDIGDRGIFLSGQQATSLFHVLRIASYNGGMDVVRKLIADKLLELDLGMSEVSKRLGRNETYIQQFLKRGSPRELNERDRRALAELLKVPEDMLRGPSARLPARNYGSAQLSEDATAQSNKPLARSSVASLTAMPYSGVAEQKILADPSLIGSIADLPVYGSELDRTGSGGFTLTSSAVDWVARPPMLARVQDAYAYIVPRNLMEPALRVGSILMMNPHLPPRMGDICVFRCTREDKVYVLGGEYRGETADTWKVRHYNPARDFTLKKAEWGACHRSVGVYFP